MISKWKNKIRCKLCGDIIESKRVHQYVQCKCGACATDGGREYFRRSWDPNRGSLEDIIEEIKELAE